MKLKQGYTKEDILRLKKKNLNLLRGGDITSRYEELFLIEEDEEREIEIEEPEEAHIINRVSKEKLIIENWQKENKGGEKNRCRQETGLDARTIRKWWNDNL